MIRTDVAASFGRASRTYDAEADIQRLAARRLADLIAVEPLSPMPRIIELGCGTGLLGEALAERLPDAASWLFTDLSPDMLRACRARSGGLTARFAVMDACRPALPPGCADLLCSSFALQWLDDLPGAFARLRRLLAPGGVLAYALPLRGSLAAWRAAHRDEGLPCGLRDLPAETDLPGVRRIETVLRPYTDARMFVRALRALGAAAARPGHVPLSPAAFRAVTARFEHAGSVADYRIAYGVLRRPPRPGVFVTGTDTDIGKTVASAILARAWGAAYWKPVQTGHALGQDDTATVQALARCTAAPPRFVLQAPLSPAAARLAECAPAFDLDDFTLPDGEGPIVVEGAGGVMVPLTDTEMMPALMQRLGLPVVLVARSGLGTINHTMLSITALRQAGLDVVLLTLVGPTNAGNRDTLYRLCGIEIVEIPHLAECTPDAIAQLAEQLRPVLQAVMPEISAPVGTKTVPS